MSDMLEKLTETKLADIRNEDTDKIVKRVLREDEEALEVAAFNSSI